MKPGLFYFSLSFLILIGSCSTVPLKDNSKAGIKLNEKLLEAAENENIDLVKKLIKEGADVNAKDQNSMTPLIIAVRNCNIDMVKIFINNHADPDVQDDSLGVTALQYAVYKQNPEIVELLINAGANPGISQTKYGLLVYAIELGNPDIVKLLIKAGLDPLKRINVYENTGDVTMLMVAAFHGAVESGRVLIDYGVDVNAADNFGDPAINWAAYANHPEFIRLLIEKGSKINVVGYNKSTALDQAVAQKSSPEVIMLLKNAGAVSAKELKN